LVSRKNTIKLPNNDLLRNPFAQRIESNASSVMRWRDTSNAHKRPLKFGWKTDVWLTRQIATLLEKEFWIRHRFTHSGRLM